MSKRVLVVDDEKLIVKGIRFSLEQDGMEVECAYDGEEALKIAKEQKFDMILLDVMLPGLSGFEVCQQIREFSDVPIVMLTAKGEDIDKILGLEYGADDYITKPFNILEVKARIKAIMRRTATKESPKAESSSMIERGDMKIDREGRRVYIEEKEINLTAKEFDVLELLILDSVRLLTDTSAYSKSTTYFPNSSALLIIWLNLHDAVQFRSPLCRTMGMIAGSL